jgi:hypothetical protein
VTPIDNSSYRLFFYQDKKDEIYHYGSEEHPKISKIAKLSLVAKCCKIRKIQPCEVSKVLRAVKITIFEPKVVIFTARVILKYSKFANFTGAYFPYFTTFRNQTLQFY